MARDDGREMDDGADEDSTGQSSRDTTTDGAPDTGAWHRVTDNKG